MEVSQYSGPVLGNVFEYCCWSYTVRRQILWATFLLQTVLV